MDLFAQMNPIESKINKQYTFVRKDRNIIYNESELYVVFEKLYQQTVNNNQTINIIHIGDSHLQADFITSIIRTTLQSKFGNAGRGLIVPLKLAHTNEPFNFNTSSIWLWKSKRCVFPKQDLPIGIGGVTISIDSTNVYFTLKTFDTGNLKYGFNKLTLFYEKDSSFGFNIKDSLGKPLAFINPVSHLQKVDYDVATWDTLINEVVIQNFKLNDASTKATIFGMSLENNQHGVLYHTIGVNGAQYKHYSMAQYFCTQSKQLSPDMIILSLGTNEANDLQFDEDSFYRDIEKLYLQLKQENPSAKFLLTTPAGSYFQKTIVNPRMSKATNTIVCFAQDHNIAYWDLYTLTGAKNSASNWKKNKLLRPDGVHYTKEGYELQGNLFCKSFLDTYNRYVTNRSK